MNRLSLARRTQIIGALVEGNSIRSVERMTDTHRDTVMRLMVPRPFVGPDARARSARPVATSISLRCIARETRAR